jgi:hypothetical protein
MHVSSSANCRTSRRAMTVWTLAILVFVCHRAVAAEGFASVTDHFGKSEGAVFATDDSTKAPTAAEAGLDWLPQEPAPTQWWTIDYRFRALCDSRTSYEFGTSESAGWAPLSRLNFSLNSCWQGLEVGLQSREWRMHVEWMMPIQRDIQGGLSDYDWQLPGEPFTDLGLMDERWTDGQMLDWGFDFKVVEGESGIPIELWMTGGFRWQRFNITAYNLVQVKENNIWPDPPYTYQGDVITFNQQYYTAYLGC